MYLTEVRSANSETGRNFLNFKNKTEKWMYLSRGTSLR